MTSLRLRAVAASVALVATMGLAACGSDDDPTPDPSQSAATTENDVDDYLDEVIDALVDVDAVRLNGSGDADGEEVELDLSFVGDETTGVIEVGGMGFEILKVDGETFFRPNDRFWTDQIGVPDEALDQVSRRWIAVDPDDDTFETFADFADREAFLDNLLTPEGEVSFGDTEKVDGTTYDVLISELEEGGEGKLYVDPDTMLPLKLDSVGVLDFEYDETDIPDAPTGDDLITLDEINQLMASLTQ